MTDVTLNNCILAMTDAGRQAIALGAPPEIVRQALRFAAWDLAVEAAGGSPGVALIELQEHVAAVKAKLAAFSGVTPGQSGNA
jgi:hypothetical protein